MDSTSPGIDFAVIGHQDSWQNISSFINGIRDEGQELSTEKIREIFSFIPPRDIFRVKVRSKSGTGINGVYIETFIDPGKLDASFIKANISKVIQAISHAKKLGARIVALGGFTSIVLEGNFEQFEGGATKFTTGNTLTASYIVKGVEKASAQHNIDLQKANVLILGATGDIGMACTQYFKHKAGKLLLCARNRSRLEKFAVELMNENVPVEYSTSIEQLVPAADIIICVASSAGMPLSNCKENLLICDAGYPKNIETSNGHAVNGTLFHGGMGQVSGGYQFSPDYSNHIYRYAAPNIIHGCILEAMVLAFEHKFENYSSGKGNISIEKMEEIYSLSLKHGIGVAPFYNSKGLWDV